VRAQQVERVRCIGVLMPYAVSARAGKASGAQRRIMRPRKSQPVVCAAEKAG